MNRNGKWKGDNHEEMIFMEKMHCGMDTLSSIDRYD